MNTRPDSRALEAAADRFARRVASRLSEGETGLPYDITERLRAARVQALDKRKRPMSVPVHQEVPAQVILGADGSAVLGGFGSEGGNWWRALVSAVPLLALVVGLVFIHSSLDSSAEEVAAVDAALLTDDLPPSAYADPGFLQFLKTGGNPSH